MVKNAGYLNISKEQMVELQRQTWTMHHNLKDWFDAFENLCLHYGFEMEVTSPIPFFFSFFSMLTIFIFFNIQIGE
jgi:hypothetical protein